MLAVLIMLTPDRQTEFINRDTAAERIMVPPNADEMTTWDCSLELLAQIYRIWEFTCQWL
jgi:hypothetical protein